MTRVLPRCRPDILFQHVPEGGVLLDTATEIYFGLNAVGARVVELLPRHGTLDDLCRALAADYPGVPLETLRADVAELLDALTEHGLLEPTGVVASPE